MPDQADLDAITDAIVSNAQGPQSASVDGTSVTARTAEDQAKALALAQQQGITVNQLFGQRTRLVNGPRQ